MTNTAPVKITATATASNGKTYQRTMKRERFRFALIVTATRGTAHFFESEAEAVAKRAAITRMSKTDFMTRTYDENAVCPFSFEIVTVTNTAA
jgi:hypothetical protein